MRKAAREEGDEAEDPDKFMQEEGSGSECGKKRPGRGKGKGRGRGRGRQPKPPAEKDEKTSGDQNAVETDAPKRKKTKTTDSTIKNLEPEFEAATAGDDDQMKKKGKLGKTKDDNKEKKPTKGHVAEGKEGVSEKEQKVEKNNEDEDGMEGPKEDEERKDKKKPEKKPEAEAPGKTTRRKVVTLQRRNDQRKPQGSQRRGGKRGRMKEVMLPTPQHPLSGSQEPPKG